MQRGMRTIKTGLKPEYSLNSTTAIKMKLETVLTTELETLTKTQVATKLTRSLMMGLALIFPANLQRELEAH